MTAAIRIEALPARLGDCLLIECLRDGDRPWRMLIDGGPVDTWPLLSTRLDRLPDPAIDIAVVTHIDDDHIAGFLPFLQSPHAEHVDDFWFNGTHQLFPAAQRSITQGDQVSTLLDTAARPWNAAFAGAAIVDPDAATAQIDIPGGPRITVLSPSPKRLAILAAKWADALDEGTRGEDAGGGIPEPAPPPLTDLSALAAEKWAKDGSAPNGSSIALLIEHRGASALLAGDAFGNVLGAGIAKLADARGVATLEIDAFKLPHHGSRANVLSAMLDLAPARHYLVSSNGDRFDHPDDQAIARTVLSAPRGAELWFNYDNERTRRWGAAALASQYGYTAHYPDDPAAGAIVELPER